MPDAAVATLASALKPSRQELRDAVAAAVLSDVPGVREAPRDEVAAGLSMIVGALVKLISGEPLSGADNADLRDVGRRWTAAGIGLATQTAVVVTAAQAAYRFLDQLAQRTRFTRRKDKQAAVEGTAVVLLAAASSVQVAVLSGASESARAATRTALVASLVDRILSATPDEWADVEDAAGQAALSDPFGLLIVLSPQADTAELLDAAAQRAADRLGGLRGAVRPDPIPHVAVLAQAVDPGAWWPLAAAAGEDVAESGCAVLPNPDPVGLARLPLVYELCRSRLHYATVQPSPSSVIDVAELDMCAMLDAAPEMLRAHAFERVAGRLLARPELFHVLDALVAVGRVHEAAPVLGRPRRSVTRDVATIREMTGYDWNNYRDRYKLTVATHLRWVAARSLARFAETAWGPVPRFSHLGGMR